MRLSFDDEDSFKEAAGSLIFNNPPRDPDSLQGVGGSSSSSSSSMPPEDPNEDPDIILEVRRVPVGSSSSGSTPSQERIEDT